MKFNRILISFCFVALLHNSVFAQSILGWQKKTIYTDAGKVSPKAVAVGDIDGDGFNDIVTGGSYSGLSWIRNLDGNGNFGSSTPIILSSSNTSNVTIADIDNDGFNDIVYRNSFIYWVRNLDGNGNFGTPINLSTTTFQSYGVQVIDIDNDGDMDIVHNRLTSVPSYQIEVLKNSGNGIFAQPILAAGSSNVSRFIATDINGDNLADVVFETPSAVSYYQQNANGTFALAENMGSTSNHMNSGILNAGNIESGDLDNDGDMDIVNVYQNGAGRNIRWFRNDNNIFANSQVLITYNSDNGSSSLDYFTIRVRDIDGDNKPDVIIQNSFTNRIVWYKNLGNATFGPQQIISQTVMQNKDVFIADINGDNNVDIVTADHTNNIIKWYNNINGNASLFQENNIDNLISGGNLHSVGDINGDGKKDVLLGSVNNPKIAWYENADGLGTFPNRQNNIITSIENSRNSLLSDINSDGLNDIIAATTVDGNYKIISFINSDNGFGSEQLIHQSVGTIVKIYLADIDGDTDQDIIATFTNGAVEILKNNGTGFDIPTQYIFGTATITKLVGADVDNDGDTDLLLTNNSAFMWAENISGSGNFSAAQTINTPLGAPRNFVVGDINNDGLKEVVYTNNNNIGYMGISGNGTFGSQTTIGPISGGSGNTVLEIADMDNDGDLDIVANSTITASTTSVLRLYENIGNSFAPFTLIGSDQDITRIFIVDINADGSHDIVASANGSNVFWYENMGLNYNRIRGTIKLDLGLNECEEGSISAQQVLVTAQQNSTSVSTFSSPNGNFSFNVTQGNYTTSVTSSFPQFSANPTSFSSQFTAPGQESAGNFCLVPSQLFNDLEISFYPVNDARPGFTSEYIVVARNKGTEPINTTLAIQYNHQKISFLNSSILPTSQIPGTLTYNIGNLQPFHSYTALLKFQVNTLPAVTIGENIVFNIVNNLQDDISPDNNNFEHNQMIVGSYDPNDIRVLEGEQVHIDNSDNYLHYIIRFQNTGNYFAERVQVNTVLDENLDWKTMEIEASSHLNSVEIKDGSIVKFIFDAIYLPAISTNEADSNGYVAFKIKPKSTVVAGDTVMAQAAIYFDYNPAIETNQASTTFISTFNNPENKEVVPNVYPNPVTSLLLIDNVNEGYEAEVYNILGVKVDGVTNATSLDFTSHATGIYMVKITTVSGKRHVFKVIKY